jgi:thiamine biosynthesis protein ThiI
MPRKADSDALIVARFGELWLKGRNRGSYIGMLERNIRGQLAGERFRLRREYDRMLIMPERAADAGAITEKLGRTFGLSGTELAVTSEPKLASIAARARSMLRSRKGARRVLISSHRSDKTLPFDSVDVVNRMKKELVKLGIEPDTKDYDTELRISIGKDRAYLSFGKSRGPGGLPVGSSGKGVVLMSGGIDSPVAAWYAMKRGVEPVYVHLHAFQEPREALEGKVPRIIGTLARYHPHYTAYFVPSHVFHASSFRFGRYELILLKAFMLRLAERVAEREGALTIFTGESLGQVASQTPANLRAEQYGVKAPVLRPLIGCDKEEIIKVAKRIGTYDDSIKQYRDVCSINAKNPVTRADTDRVREMANSMGMRSIVTRSLKLATVVGA